MECAEVSHVSASPATARRSSSRVAKSRPRRGAVQSTDPPRPYGLSCGCDFAVRYEAIGCSGAPSRRALRPLSAGPFRVASQGQFFLETLNAFSRLCTFFESETVSESDYKSSLASFLSSKHSVFVKSNGKLCE